MTARLVALAFDAVAPSELARFWAHALHWDIRQTDGIGIEIVPTDATPFHVLVRPVAHEKAGQNRIHLDLTTCSPTPKATSSASSNRATASSPAAPASEPSPATARTPSDASGARRSDGRW